MKCQYSTSMPVCSLSGRPESLPLMHNLHKVQKKPTRIIIYWNFITINLNKYLINLNLISNKFKYRKEKLEKNCIDPNILIPTKVSVILEGIPVFNFFNITSSMKRQIHDAVAIEGEGGSAHRHCREELGMISLDRQPPSSQRNGLVQQEGGAYDGWFGNGAFSHLIAFTDFDDGPPIHLKYKLNQTGFLLSEISQSARDRQTMVAQCVKH